MCSTYAAAKNENVTNLLVIMLFIAYKTCFNSFSLLRLFNSAPTFTPQFANTQYHLARDADCHIIESGCVARYFNNISILASLCI